ncbi:MAG: DUF2269 family protein [Actinobacteria bacterium]|nr:DUF2269 family protein [Actinomycetota bacterium]
MEGFGRLVYRWWVFLHIVGVFGFLVAHGVSVAITFQLRTERDPRRIGDLLALSGSSIRAFYVSLLVLLLGGVVAGFLGEWWSEGWIWAALAVLILTSIAMLLLARPYYRRVGLVARALAGGSEAVSEEEFDRILRSRRPITVAVLGFGALLVILYLMMFKPTLGLSASTTSDQEPGQVAVAARNIAFDTDRLSAPASQPFTIAFDNQDAGVPHNVSIYPQPGGAQAFQVFVGEIITGPDELTYEVPAQPPGTYSFVCDVHPVQMVGTLVIE